MRELQREIGLWQDKVFPDVSLEGLTMHLREEVEEMEEAAFAAYDSLMSHSDPLVLEVHEHFRHELADVAIMLLGIANHFDVDLQRCVEDKMKINYARKWVTDVDGVIRHSESKKLEGRL